MWNYRMIPLYQEGLPQGIEFSGCARLFSGCGLIIGPERMENYCERIESYLCMRTGVGGVGCAGVCGAGF